MVRAFFTIVKGTTFLSASTLILVAKHVALYGILALGMTFVIITGGIDLSVGSVIILAVVIDQTQRNLQAKMALQARNENK